jgi:prophage antirepressor-like protein
MASIKNMQIEIFHFEKNTIRVIGTHENPKFVVKDVCDVLGLTNPTHALKNIPNKWKDDLTKSEDSSGRKINMLTVTEPGLYKLIIRSNKPAAEKFQEWICEEVLPSIRKKGEYVLEEYKKKIEEQKQALEQKTREIEEQKQALEDEKEQVELLKLKNCKQPMIHKEKYVIYMVTTESQEQKGVYNVGRSINLGNRLHSYNKMENCKVIYFRENKSRNHMIIAEKLLLAKLEEYRECANHDRFILPKGKNVGFFKDIMDECANVVNSIKEVSENNIQEDRKLHDKEYYTDNAKYIQKRNKIYYKKFKNHVLGRNKKYRIANTNKIKQHNKNYRMNNKLKISFKRKEQYQQNREVVIARVKNYAEKNKEKVSLQHKKYREKNKEYLSQKKKEYVEKNKDKLWEKSKEYYKQNSEKIKQKTTNYYHENKEKMLERQKNYAIRTKEIRAVKTKIYRELNKEKINSQRKEYREKNKDKLTEKQREKILCECGTTYSRSAKSSHIKSIKHQKFVDSTKEFPNQKCECGSVYTNIDHHIKTIKHKNFVNNKIELKEPKENCECGGLYIKSKKSSHIKCNKHQNYLKTKEMVTPKELCECGGSYIKFGKNRHLKTDKHQNFVKSNQNSTII